MRRTLITGLACAICACGHPAKPTTPPPPLVDPKPDTADTKPTDTKPDVKPPPKDPDPIDVPLAAARTTYKLVNPGKGTKAVMKINGEKGAKQTLELALDFAGKQVAPADLGGTQEDVAPTLVLASDLEVTDNDASGSKFKVSFTGVDARDRPGAKATKDQFKTELAVLAGTVLSGVVSSSGQLANLSLHVDKPSDKTMAALELIRISLMPMWPVLPTEAVGVGAKWTVTSTYTIADRIEATQTTDMEIISHKGKDWVMKGKTSVKGADQKIKETQFEKIGGTGSFEATLTDGVFAPASSTKLASDFTASIEGPDKKQASVQFHLDQGIQVTPK